MQQYSPDELKARLGAAGPRPVLVDVREPWEYERCHLEGSINVPLGEVPARVAELPHDAELVMICHHGMRSEHAGEYLRHSGFERVINLDGGIDAWAALVDQQMARY
jgi:rhodanese-related sulfurtransferase